jgi:hypothetical protein
MNISSIGSAYSASVTPSQASTSAAAIGSPSPGDAQGPGALFQKLKTLQSSDPAKFKQVAADMAKQLRADAKTQQGPGAQMLSKLADTLDTAAQTGKLPAPPRPADQAAAPQAGQAPKGTHHHHHAGGGGPPQVSSEILQAFNSALDAASQAQASSKPTSATDSK